MGADSTALPQRGKRDPLAPEAIVPLKRQGEGGAGGQCDGVALALLLAGGGAGEGGFWIAGSLRRALVGLRFEFLAAGGPREGGRRGRSGAALSGFACPRRAALADYHRHRDPIHRDPHPPPSTTTATHVAIHPPPRHPRLRERDVAIPARRTSTATPPELFLRPDDCRRESVEPHQGRQNQTRRTSSFSAARWLLETSLGIQELKISGQGNDALDKSRCKLTYPPTFEEVIQVSFPPFDRAMLELLSQQFQRSRLPACIYTRPNVQHRFKTFPKLQALGLSSLSRPPLHPQERIWWIAGYIQ